MSLEWVGTLMAAAAVARTLRLERQAAESISAESGRQALVTAGQEEGGGSALEEQAAERRPTHRAACKRPNSN